MRNWTKALAMAVALCGTCVALGQDDTTTGTTDLFASLGIFGPILLIVALIVWASWGGFRWILPS